MKLFHNRRRKVLGFHCLILHTKLLSDSLYFISFGMKFQIIGRTDLEQLKTVLNSEITKSDFDHKI